MDLPFEPAVAIVVNSQSGSSLAHRCLLHAVDSELNPRTHIKVEGENPLHMCAMAIHHHSCPHHAHTTVYNNNNFLKNY